MNPDEHPAPVRDRPAAPSLPPGPGLEPTALAPLGAGQIAAAPAPEAEAALLGTPAFAALRQNAWLGYFLQAATVFCGITPFIAVIVAYANRGPARGTWLESHYEWQIETFWKMLMFGFGTTVIASVGRLLLGDGVVGNAPGVLAIAALVAWYANRVVKGWTRLADDDPVTDY